MAVVIDPPEGWRYGFPKVIPDDVQDERKWLVENGYPQEEIDKLANSKYGDLFYCRYWEE